MSSQLSRSAQQPLWGGMRICKASTSRQGFATSSSYWSSEDAKPTGSTASMQQTETQAAPPRLFGDIETGGNASNDRKPPNRPAFNLPPYPEWIQTDAKKYEDAPRGRGPFWLGETPFPLNPSFDPPPPIAQSQKRALWKLHQSDPANTVRVLSGKYGISMERLRAILRLQALETEWNRKGEALQQPFQEGMDRLLGAAERPQGAALDEQVATERVASTPRAATFEQFPMTSTSQDDPSILAKALKEESSERRERRRTLPTGGPASKGPHPTVTNIHGTPGRASLTIVDMSKRPTSYVGGGVITRNQHRAEKKKGKVLRGAEKRATRQKKADAKNKQNVSDFNRLRTVEAGKATSSAL